MGVLDKGVLFEGFSYAYQSANYIKGRHNIVGSSYHISHATILVLLNQL